MTACFEASSHSSVIKFIHKLDTEQRPLEISTPPILVSIPFTKTSTTMVQLTAPDHAKAMNLARRFTAQNENDLMRKSTTNTDLFVTIVLTFIDPHYCRGGPVW